MSDERTLGKLEARVDNVESDIREMKADVKAILEAVNQTKGGWKTLAGVGALAGACGAFFVKLIPFTNTLPR